MGVINEVRDCCNKQKKIKHGASAVRWHPHSSFRWMCPQGCSKVLRGAPMNAPQPHRYPKEQNPGRQSGTSPALQGCRGLLGPHRAA